MIMMYEHFEGNRKKKQEDFFHVLLMNSYYILFNNNVIPILNFRLLHISHKICVIGHLQNQLANKQHML